MKFNSLLLVAALLYGSSGVQAEEGFSTADERLPSRVREVWNSTVFIERKARSSRNVVGWGSGVVIGVRRDRAIIATCDHVVRCQGAPCRLEVRVGRDRDLADHVKVLAMYPEKDLAFLEVELPRGVRVVPVTWELSPERALQRGVYVVGYPSLAVRSKSVWRVERPSDWRSPNKRFSMGQGQRIIKRYPMKGGAYVLVLAHSADVLPGNSGGPITTETGEVLGLNALTVFSAKPDGSFAYCDPRENHCAYLAISAADVLTAYRGLAPR